MNQSLTEIWLYALKALIPRRLRLRGSHEGVKRSVENVLTYFPESIGRPKLIFEAARKDPAVPYESTVAAIAQYVKKGVLDGVAISEVGAHSIAKADDEFPISSVEVDLSLLTRDIWC